VTAPLLALLLVATPAARIGVRAPDGELFTVEATEAGLSTPAPGVAGLRLERRVEGRVGAVLVELSEHRRPLPAAPEGCALRIEETLLFAGEALATILRAETTLCGGESRKLQRLQSFHLADPGRAPLRPEALGLTLPAPPTGCLRPAPDQLGLRREEGRTHARLALEPGPGCEEPARATRLAGALLPGLALPEEQFRAHRERRAAVIDAIPVGAATVLVGRRGLVLVKDGAQLASVALSVEAIVLAEPLPGAAP